MKIIHVLNIKFLPVQFSFFLMLGIALGFVFTIGLKVVIISIIISYTALIFFYFKALVSFKPPLYFSVFTAILLVFIGVLRVDLQDPKHNKNNFEKVYSSNENIIIRIDKVLKTNKYFNKYEGEIIQVNNTKTSGKILINKPLVLKDKTFIVDDILMTNAAIRNINKALNPNVFEYKSYLQKQGIYYQINLKENNYLKVKKKKNTLKGLSFKLREKINLSLKKHHFSKESLAIINAILLGQRNDISTDMFENYKDAGAIHILAVSGLHIGIILLILNLILQPLDNFKFGKPIKLVLVVLFLWMYAFVAGMSASVIRAVTMFTAVAIGMISNRRLDVKNSLVVSLFVLLLIHPLFLFDVGFQLSYIAVFSIVWLYPYFNKMWKPKYKLVDYFWKLLSISFAAQIGILPLSLFYFHQFPGLFFISSLVIIPFLGFILGLGILVIILSLMQLLPQILAILYENMIILMNKFVATIAQQEVFIVYNIPFSFLAMLTVYLFIVFTINWLNTKSIRNLNFVFGALLLIQINLIHDKINTQRTKEFIVFNQSKKSLITHRKGYNMLVYQSLKNEKLINNQTLKAYKLGVKNIKTELNALIPNVIKMNSKKILILDSLGIYKPLTIQPEIIILTQSPKINLERMIKELRPKLIIADGSNYNNYKDIWKQTCAREKINFINTSRDGAYHYSY